MDDILDTQNLKMVRFHAEKTQQAVEGINFAIWVLLLIAIVNTVHHW